MAELDGKDLGAFQALQAINEGGHAVVYRARDPMGRTVALKILKPDVANQPGFMERFEKEARIIANLDHPNILTVFSYGKEQGHVYLAMRFIQTGTLADILESGEKLAPEKILHVITHVGRALDHAHKSGVIHRDVKPENILVDRNGTCILSDFGIAKVEGNPASTSPGMVIGTYYYMSPEQCMGEELDGRSDIYALGVILYQMLVGKRPFTAPTPFSILQKHVHEEPSFPADVAVSPEVKAVVLKAMAKKKDERFQTCDELRQALKQALSPSRITPQPPVPADAPRNEQARDPSRRAISDAIMNAGNPVFRQVDSQAPTQDVPAPEEPCEACRGGPRVAHFLSACVVGMALGGTAFFSALPGRGGNPDPKPRPQDPSSPVPVAGIVAEDYMRIHGKPTQRRIDFVSILLDGSFEGPDNPGARGVRKGLSPLLDERLRKENLKFEWASSDNLASHFDEDPKAWVEEAQKAPGDLVLVLTRENEKTRRIGGKRGDRRDSGLQVTVHVRARMVRRGDRAAVEAFEMDLQSRETFNERQSHEEGVAAAFVDCAGALADSITSAVISQRDAVLQQGSRYVLLVKDSLFTSFNPELEPTLWLMELIRSLPLAVVDDIPSKKQLEASGPLAAELLDSRITFSFGGERSYLLGFLEAGLREYFRACDLKRAPIVQVDEKNTLKVAIQ